MNIWLVTIGEQLPVKENIRKLRTAYLADELLSRGHAVLWWTSAFDHLKKDWAFEQDEEIDVSEHYKIVAIKGTGYKKNISLARFWDHRVVAAKFKRRAKQYKKPDAIVVSMPTYDLAFEAVKFANEHNIPVIVDIRDKWPDIFVDSSPLPSFLTKKLLFTEFNRLSKALKHATGITAVSNTFLEWALDYAKRKKSNADKVFYLGYKKSVNTDPIIGDHFPLILDKIKNKFVITFIGTFEAFHDPRILLDAADYLKNDPNIHIVLAGDGRLMGEISQKAENMKNVTITGWLDQKHIDQLLSCSNVGVCTTTHQADLFPNKACSYLAYGLPVISAFNGDLKNLLETYQAGYYYIPMDVESLVEVILLLSNSMDLCHTMGDNARQIFETNLDGKVVYSEYADHIEMLVKNNEAEKLVC